MKQAEMEVLFLGAEGVSKWKTYYAQRGIDIEVGLHKLNSVYP